MFSQPLGICASTNHINYFISKLVQSFYNYKGSYDDNDRERKGLGCRKKKFCSDFRAPSCKFIFDCKWSVVSELKRFSLTGLLRVNGATILSLPLSPLLMQSHHHEQFYMLFEIKKHNNVKAQKDAFIHRKYYFTSLVFNSTQCHLLHTVRL